MCKGCKGLGSLNIVNVDSIIPDFNKTIYNGGIEPVGSFKNNWIFKQLEYISNKFKVIGSAHNLREINIKKRQGCTDIFLSRLFKTDYTYKNSYLGLIRFNLLKMN